MYLSGASGTVVAEVSGVSNLNIIGAGELSAAHAEMHLGGCSADMLCAVQRPL